MRPLLRAGYTNMRMHPRDADPNGIVTVKFRVRILLVLTAGGIDLGIPALFGFLQEVPRFIVSSSSLLLSRNPSEASNRGTDQRRR
jgi:hypothetical protein